MRGKKCSQLDLDEYCGMQCSESDARKDKEDDSGDDV